MSYTTGTRSQGPQPGRGRPIPQNQGTGGQSRQAGGAMMATSPHMYNQPAAAMFLSSPGAQHLPPYPGSQMNFPSPLYILQTNNPAPNANQVYYQPQIPNPQLTGPSQQQQPGRPPSNPALIPAPPNIIQQQTPPNNFNNGNMAAMQQPQYPQQMRGVPAAQVGFPWTIPMPSMTMQPPPAVPPNQAHVYPQQMPPQRKKNVIKIVNPETHAVVNEEALATSGANTSNSSNRSTPTAAPPPLAATASAPSVQTTASPAQPLETAHTDGADIKCQFKAQVKASLSSSTTSTNSEVSPSNLTNGSMEASTDPSQSVQPDGHAKKESEEKISVEQSQVVDTAASPADEKDGGDSVESVDSHPSAADSCGTTVEPHVAADEPVEPQAQPTTDNSSNSEESPSLKEQITPTSDSAEMSLKAAKLTTETVNGGDADKPAAEVADIADELVKEDDSMPPSYTEQPATNEAAVPVVQSEPAQEEAISTNQLEETKPVPQVDLPVDIPTEVKSASTELKLAPTEVVSTLTEVKLTPTEVELTPTEVELTPTEVKLTPTEVKLTPTEVKSAPTEVKLAPTEVEASLSVSPKKVVPSPSDSELMPPPDTPGSSAPSTPMRSTPVPSTPDVKENTPVSTPPPLKGSKSMGADPAVMNKKPAAVKSQDTEGKTKTYSREFLMSLQNSALSKTKPDALGSSSILQEIMSIGRGPIPGARRDFNPDYFKPASSPRNSMHKRASVSRDKNMGPSQSMTRSHAKEITYKREEVKLTKAANAWKPGDVGANVSEEEKNHLALLKSFRGILNKITPSTFANLLKKILALPVKTEKDLQEVMILVFDKARNEPDFCKIYATLCQGIAKEFKAQIEATGSEVNFRKLLLVRCQHEFERLAEDDSAMAKRAEQVKEAKTPEEAAKLEEELKAFQTKARHRKLGYMRFIGELFLLQMLTPKIMHECIINLLKAADEESLEYLCRLWTTIGKVFDVGDKAKAYNDQYFNQMKKIANGQSRNVCLRIRFALQDVIDLRENNWVPRRDKNVPKTLKEIHAQAAMEAQATQAMLEKPLPTRSSQGRAPPAPRSRRDEQDGAGWSHVKTGSQRVDPTKLKLTKQSILGGDGEVQLGPAKGFGGSWGRGSSGSGKNTPPLQPEERQSAPSNRFSALSGGADRDHRDERSRSGNRMPISRGSGSMGRGMNRNAPNRMGTPRGSMEKDRQRSEIISAVRQISRGSGSRGPSRENSVEGRNLRTPTPTRNQATASRSGSAQAGVTKQLSKEEFETKIKSIIDEYLHNNDMKEVLEIVREEMSQQINKELITDCAINHVIERSDQARKGAGHMLGELLKHKLLPLDAHLKGLGAVLEFADDLAIDIPNVWEYFGQLIAPMFTVAAVPLSQLETVCSPLLDIGKAATLAAHILKESSHHMGHVELGKRWSENKLTWSMFLSASEDESSFIETHKLQYTLETNLPAGSSGSHGKCDVPATLEKMLKKEPNETVFDWIDSNLTVEDCHQTAFIRSLSSAVAQSCLGDDGSWQESKFKDRVPLLVRYYDNKPDRELAALFAFEELMEKLEHPANLFTELCVHLNENDLIADESFFHWEEKSKNGVAVKSVGKFFTWLKSSD